MRTIFDLLDEIKKRPSMFLGGGSEDISLQLDNLQFVIFGYEWALEIHGIDEPGINFSRNLAEYMRQQFNTSTSCGPVGAVRTMCGSDAEAWEKFWEVIDKFRAETYGSAPK